MARSQKTFPVMVVLLSSFFVLSTSLSKDNWSDYQGDPNFPDYPLTSPTEVDFDDVAPEPSTLVEVPDTVLPPEPASGYYEFLEDCSKKITPKCGAEIYTSIVDNQKISFDCCIGLVKMGHACHIGLAKLIMGFPETKLIKSQILPRSVKAWKDCVLAVRGSPSPSPSA